MPALPLLGKGERKRWEALTELVVTQGGSWEPGWAAVVGACRERCVLVGCQSKTEGEREGGRRREGGENP
jgi:hypothetical protein